MILEIKNLNKSFDGAPPVLRDINLTINEGDVIAVLGPSGGGKTTLLRCMNFLEVSDSGLMIFDGKTYNLAKMSKKDISSVRMRTAFVFQNYNLFLNKTAFQNVTEGLVTARKIDKKDAKEIALKALSDVGLADKLDSYPNQLSGGQQQRVAIARAVALNPEIIYFDEPTSALDPELTHEVLDVINRLANEGRTMLVVTHELDFAKKAATRIVFMDGGTISAQEDPAAFFENPESERVKQFLANTYK